MNQRLLSHFQGLSVKTYQVEKLFSGGAFFLNRPVTGGLWMHDNYNDANYYAKWGKPSDPQLKCVVLETEPVKHLNLIEFLGNHVSILQSIYQGAWTHIQFHRDLDDIHKSGLIEFDGFFRPRSDEYRILNVEKNLIFI